jgi:hypothetical protein
MNKYQKALGFLKIVLISPKMRTAKEKSKDIGILTELVNKSVPIILKQDALLNYECTKCYGPVPISIPIQTIKGKVEYDDINYCPTCGQAIDNA